MIGKLIKSAGYLGLLMVLWISAAEAQVEAGDLQIAGTACLITDAEQIGKVEIIDGNLVLPIALRVQAAGGRERLKRGSCGNALPLKVEEGYRLRISDVAVRANLQLPAKAQGQIQVEIFQAGSRGLILKATDKAAEGRLNRSYVLASGSAAELVTECGASLILRAQGSMIVMNAATRGTGSLGLLRARVTVEKCL
jgi:hypothetical protein